MKNLIYNERKTLILALVLSLIPISLSFWRPSSDPAPNMKSRTMSMDTHIPKGFVLVPIEITNFDSVDSILGPYGVVDLFTGASHGSLGRLVVKNARLLRAPNNPSHFAVLIKETETGSLLSHGHEFTATVKRPSSQGTELMGSAQRRKIIYGESK